MPAPTLNTNPLGNPNQGVVGAVNKSTGLAQQNVPKTPVSENGTGAVGPLAPGKTTGLAQQSLGVKAKTPDQNITKTPTTLPASQVAPSQPSDISQSDMDTVKNAYTNQQQQNTGSQTQTPPPMNGTGTSNNPYNLALGGLAGANQANQTLGQNAQKIATDAQNAYQQVGQNAANLEGGYTSGMIAPRAAGLAQQVAQTASANQANIIAGANLGLAGNAQALTGQAQTQSAQQAAGGLSQPVTQFGQLTSPFTGTPIGGGTITSNPQLNTAVQSAMQLVQNGASPQDPAVQSLLSPFGYAGQQAFTNAQQQSTGGTYNPTAQSAVASSNASQGVNYKQQAVDLNTSLQQLDSASTLATNFLSSANANGIPLNSTQNPNFNAGLNTYIGSITNPAAKLQYNAIIGDISKFTSSILASNSGQIPTAVTNTLQSFDPSTLSAAQLGPYLQTLQDLGNNQLNVLQNQTQNLVPNANTNTYVGAPATQSTNAPTAPNSTVANSAPQNPVQTGLGLGMNLIGGIENFVSGLAGKLFSAL